MTVMIIVYVLLLGWCVVTIVFILYMIGYSRGKDKPTQKYIKRMICKKCGQVMEYLSTEE